MPELITQGEMKTNHNKNRTNDLHADWLPVHSIHDVIYSLFLKRTGWNIHVSSRVTFSAMLFNKINKHFNNKRNNKTRTYLNQTSAAIILTFQYSYECTRYISINKLKSLKFWFNLDVLLTVSCIEKVKTDHTTLPFIPALVGIAGI